MKIDDIRVRLIQKDDSKVRGVASIVIEDCFVIHDIKILEGTSGNFVAMPRRKKADGTYLDVAHPLNTQTRENLSTLILAEYDKVKAQEQN